MFNSGLKRLAQDESGNAVTEFGLIAIPFTMMLIGALDAGHSFYVRSVLTGEMNRLSRSSSLEGATVSSQQAAIDDRVRKTIRQVIPSATVTTTRRYYKTFSDAARAQAETVIEPDPLSPTFNAKCDSGEKYVDANLNNTWDRDGGDDGQGGARDVVIITVQVAYTRMIPVQKLIGIPNNVVRISDSILANQPYGNQSQYGTAVERDCP
jgi:Flp pilus assembly protein TadG